MPSLRGHPISSEYLDCSGSMSSKTWQAREAAIEFLKIAIPEDEFFLVSLQ